MVVMENVKLEIANFLKDVDASGSEILTSDKIEELESLVDACNKSMGAEADKGVAIVADGVYDKLRDLLYKNKPDSEFLGIWGEDVETKEEMLDDINIYQRSEPMCSIDTVKKLEDINDIRDFYNALPYEDGEIFDLHYSCKENGHGIRVVYAGGYLEKATSRGRATAGRDISKQLRVILGDQNDVLVDDYEDLDVVEIRGEVVLPFKNLDKAREFNPNIKTAFTGVSSMLRDSASEEEWGLLEFVAYRCLCGIDFETKEDEYLFLEELGFTTPLAFVQDHVSKETLVESMLDMVAYFEEEMQGYEYFTDGVVVQVNSYYDFKKMGKSTSGKDCYLGNLALKIGQWKQDLYSGIITRIDWSEGKTKLIPEAVIEDGVLTASGNEVRRVPLYNPKNMLLLEAYPGNVIYFRYGGEAGVVPCYPDGSPLTGDFLDSKFAEDYDEYDYKWYML